MHTERFEGRDLKVPVQIKVRAGHYALEDKPDDTPRQVLVTTFTSLDGADAMAEDTFIVNIEIGRQLAESILNRINEVEAQAN